MGLPLKVFVLLCLTSTAYNLRVIPSLRNLVDRQRFRVKRQSGGYSDEPNEAPSQEFFSNPFASPEVGSQDPYGSSLTGSSSFGPSSFGGSSTGNDYSQTGMEPSFPDKIPYAQLADPSVTKKTITDTSYLSQSISGGSTPSRSSYDAAQASQYGQYGSSNQGGSTSRYSGYGGDSQQSLYPQSGTPYQTSSQGRYGQSNSYNPNSYANYQQPSRLPNPRSMYSHSYSNYGLQGGVLSSGYANNALSDRS